MQPLPTRDLRSNLGTWAVPVCLLPAVTQRLVAALPPEPFDPTFQGQDLETLYFDTPRFQLRKARLGKDRYLTLRLRCYPGDIYALSAKTENKKYRRELSAEVADLLRRNGSLAITLPTLLPADLLARLLELTAGEDLQPVITLATRRYAVEDDVDRYTLDVTVRTDTGKRLPYSVLEFKSSQADREVDCLAGLPLRPIKLSKYLWATEV